MGYYADSVESDFTIPADKFDAALEAINAEELWKFWHGGRETVYADLIDAVEETTSFEGWEVTNGEFVLGWHNDKYLTGTDEVLKVLARFANDGSYVRFSGEDHSLFGFRVVDGELRSESGSIGWTLDN